MFLFTEIASGAVLNKTDPNVLSKTNHITIPFVENKGQLKDPDTVFYSNTFAGRVSVNRDGSIGYHLVGNQAGQEKQLIEIREKFSGALKTSPSGGDKAIAKVSHFQGQDPDKWVTDIPTFNSVHMGEIYQGVSLKLQAHANNVEKIFFVHPGSDPKKIQRKVYVTYFQDGLWDVVLGLFLLGWGFAILFDFSWLPSGTFIAFFFLALGLKQKITY